MRCVTRVCASARSRPARSGRPSRSYSSAAACRSAISARTIRSTSASSCTRRATSVTPRPTAGNPNSVRAVAPRPKRIGDSVLSVFAAAGTISLEGVGTALVIENDPTDDLRRLGEWLTESELELTVLRPHAGDALPATLDGYAGLI